MYNSTLVDLFYQFKPFFPRRLQLFLRRRLVLIRRKKFADTWPIDSSAARKPANWRGWPDGKKFAFVLTHDVDTSKGYENCSSLMKLEQEFDFRSSFNFVPERDYALSHNFIRQLRDNGFEVGVHDLHHNGKLFRSEKSFRKGSDKINAYLKQWRSRGFRSGAMHCNLDWIHLLNITHDSSTFDTDPFEPKAESTRTIFPFWVPSNSFGTGYVELPYTLPQDFTLFVLMQENDIGIWKKKIDWLAEQGGMALVLTHPDYMNFNEKILGAEEFPVRFYAELLAYVKSKYQDEFWHALPQEIADLMGLHSGRDQQ